MKRAVLLLCIMASCAEARIEPPSQSPWCLSGMDLPRDAVWVPLPENAATIVRPENVQSLLPLLENRTLVEITRAGAEEAAGPLPSFEGGYYFLVRGGVIGGPAVTLEQYLRNAGSAIRARASTDPEGRLLLVQTFQMSAARNYRNVPIVVWTPSRVTGSVARCMAAA